MEWTDQMQDEHDRYIELRQEGYCDYDAKVLSKVHNKPQPDVCPKCGGELKASPGYVGETVLWCPNEKCDAGIVWEDSEAAIRSVL